MTKKQKNKKKEQNKTTSEKLGFSGLYEGPGGFRKLGEACRKSLHLFSSKSHGGIRSYDQKTKKVNEY